ncbi:MAG: hypothetical protein R2853_02445 [Thermomicrobiales bacterium]
MATNVPKETPVPAPAPVSRSGRRRLLAALALTALRAGSFLASSLQPETTAADPLDRARRRKSSQRKKRHSRLEKRRRRHRGAGSTSRDNRKGIYLNILSEEHAFSAEIWGGNFGWELIQSIDLSPRFAYRWDGEHNHVGLHLVNLGLSNPFIWVEAGANDREVGVAVQDVGAMTFTGYVGPYELAPVKLAQGQSVEAKAFANIDRKISVRIERLSDTVHNRVFKITLGKAIY